MMRYQAMLTTEGQWFKPTFRNFAKWTVLQIIPMSMIIYWYSTRRVS